MINFKVTLLKKKGDYSSKMLVNILANSVSEARQKSKSMYPMGSVTAVVKS